MIRDDDVFGLLKPHVDVHTLGMSTISMLLRQSGYTVSVAPQEVMEATTALHTVNGASRVVRWVLDAGVTVLSLSYRLDPDDGVGYFCRLHRALSEGRCLAADGGPVRVLAFAGLPDACRKIEARFAGAVICFPGDETPEQSLSRYGVPEHRYPKAFTSLHQYDASLQDFARRYIESGRYRTVGPADHYGYRECGRPGDSFEARLDYCRSHGSLPIVRAHAGPYAPDRCEAVRQFVDWCRQLGASRLLDVLSIGSSQLTQQAFGEDWEGRPNGGGVPVNSEAEYREIREAARPMLVRTYAGTKDVPAMAQMHERTLDICWHALSMWWFCELDGRGANTLLDNLAEHIEAARYIASTGKPLEPNVPHHFAFRGADDVTFIVSAYLAAKMAKICGIRHLILQDMLNTPKYTWGIQDVAKGRAMLRLVRSLEDADFRVSLQTRAGLDYFSPDMERAKVQLAAVTALMDDIDPANPASPEIVHVVSYSEAVRLATPDIITDSIRITLGALAEYRRLKSLGRTYDTAHCPEIAEREAALYDEASWAVRCLEQHFPDLYTAHGLCRVFEMGFLPVPYLMDEHQRYPQARRWPTTVIDGAVRVVDDQGRPISTRARYASILSSLPQ